MNEESFRVSAGEPKAQSITSATSAKNSPVGSVCALPRRYLSIEWAGHGRMQPANPCHKGRHPSLGRKGLRQVPTCSNTRDEGPAIRSPTASSEVVPASAAHGKYWLTPSVQTEYG